MAGTLLDALKRLSTAYHQANQAVERAREQKHDALLDEAWDALDGIN